jgi:hypothetical protein
MAPQSQMQRHSAKLSSPWPVWSEPARSIATSLPWRRPVSSIAVRAPAAMKFKFSCRRHPQDWMCPARKREPLDLAIFTGTWTHSSRLRLNA